jgi:hypothetical protein
MIPMVLGFFRGRMFPVFFSKTVEAAPIKRMVLCSKELSSTGGLMQQSASLFVVALYVDVLCWCSILVPRIEVDLGEARILFQ